jgi:hypothetical protein
MMKTNTLEADWTALRVGTVAKGKAKADAITVPPATTFLLPG